MKQYFLAVLLASIAITSVAQQKENKSKRELRAENKILIAEKVDSMIIGRYLTFKARSASPMGWSTIQLTSEYDLKLHGDSVNVYLPFYGRAYQVDYMSTEGGIKLNELIDDYQLSRRKGQYEIRFNARSKSDLYRFHLSVSPTGYASLSVVSNNRQSISFSGILNGLGI